MSLSRRRVAEHRNKVGSYLVGKGRVIRPKSAQETDALRFDSKFVVNGVAQLLSTAQVALCRLNGHVAE